MTALRSRKRIFMIALMLVYGMMLLLNLLTPLTTDDYMYMYRFDTGERITTLGDVVFSGIRHYAVMNGRIVTNVIFTQMMLLVGRPLFQMLNAGVYLAFVLGLYHLLQRGQKYNWPLFLALHSAVFLFAPSFGITMLWLNGSCNYLWGTTLIVYALLPFARAVLAPGAAVPRKPLQGLCALAALMAGNVMENSSLAMIAWMALCLFWLRLQRKQTPFLLYALLALAILGYAALMASPGLALDRRSAGSFGNYLANFITCMERLSGKISLLYAYVLLLSLTPKNAENKDRIALSLGFVLCGLLANLAMIIPDYFPYRADLGWVVFFLIANGLLLPSLARLHQGALWHALAGCLALAAVVTFMNAVPNNFNRYLQEQTRIEAIKAQRDAGVSEIVIYDIESRTRYDVFNDGVKMSANPSYRPNVCFAKFYGIGSIEISEEAY